MSQDAEDGGSTTSLSARLQRLFEVTRPGHEPSRAWRNSEVVAACRANGRELSESHLSELRRGVKRNPTMRTLQALAWFFDVRSAYFTDDQVAAEVERDLADRENALQAQLDAQRQADQEVTDAARELQEAMRKSGVTKMAHRHGSNTNQRQNTIMMRALARALTQDDAGDGNDPGPDQARNAREP